MRCALQHLEFERKRREADVEVDAVSGAEERQSPEFRTTDGVGFS
jgi:hypothetical protein